MGGKTGNKAGYFDKLKGLLEEYKSIFIVTVDNVSSQQMHEIRQSMRGESVVLMGKNTMVRTLRAFKTNERELHTDEILRSRSVVLSRHSLARTLNMSACFHM